MQIKSNIFKIKIGNTDALYIDENQTITFGNGGATFAKSGDSSIIKGKDTSGVGGNIIIVGGEGTTRGGDVILGTSKTTETYSPRLIILSKQINLTNNMDSDILSITLSGNFKYAGGDICVTFHADDGLHSSSVTDVISFSMITEGTGNVNAAIGTSLESGVAEDILNGLNRSWSVVESTTTGIIRVQPNTSLSPTTFKCTIQIRINTNDESIIIV